MQLNILLLLIAFYKFLHRQKVKISIFVQKKCDHMLLMTSYLVTIATKICLKDKRTATENGMS